MAKKMEFSEELLDRLRVLKLASHFHGKPALTTGRRLERDGRRRRAILRQLIEAELISPIEDTSERYEVLDGVLANGEVTELDLTKEWISRYVSNDKREAYRCPWIPFSKLSVANQLSAVNDSMLDWFVVAQGPYQYMHGFAKTAQTIGETKYRHAAFNRYWDGPFNNIRDVTQRLEDAPGTCVAVSSARLRASVDEFLLNEKRQWQFANNLLHGLIELELVPRYQLEKEDGTPAIDHQLIEGYGIPGLSPEPENPEEVAWETNLTESIARLESGIRHRQRKLRILHDINESVHRYGGWPKFKEAFWALLCRCELEKKAAE